ncbi:hypothetical protein [Candidatus Pyrohabitans sp.]
MNRITKRCRFRLVPEWFWRVLPRLPFWKPVLWGYFILRCQRCGLEILTEDPRDFIHIVAEEDLEEVV